jgi:hypothetical protein
LNGGIASAGRNRASAEHMETNTCRHAPASAVSRNPSPGSTMTPSVGPTLKRRVPISIVPLPAAMKRIVCAGLLGASTADG